MLINTHSYYEYSFSQPPLHLENEVFLLPNFSEKERLECSLFASGGNAVSGIGGGSNVEGTAIEEEELLKWEQRWQFRLWCCVQVSFPGTIIK